MRISVDIRPEHFIESIIEDGDNAEDRILFFISRLDEGIGTNEFTKRVIEHLQEKLKTIRIPAY